MSCNEKGLDDDFQDGGLEPAASPSYKDPS